MAHNLANMLAAALMVFAIFAPSSLGGKLHLSFVMYVFRSIVSDAASSCCEVHEGSDHFPS